MIRPPPAISEVICPHCSQLGIHGTPDECIRALKRQIEKEKAATPPQTKALTPYQLPHAC